MERNDIEIFVATHKLYEVPPQSMYKPICVGATLKDDNEINEFKNSGYILDSEDENISYKNGSYCELTALYWAWKNSTAEYVGLVHYRRHFTLKKFYC